VRCLFAHRVSGPGAAGGMVAVDEAMRAKIGSGIDGIGPGAAPGRIGRVSFCARSVQSGRIPKSIRPMKLDEFAFFNQQLAAMLRDGIPLEGALAAALQEMRAAVAPHRVASARSRPRQKARRWPTL